MQDCWQQDPKLRPSFATVTRRLKAMQHWFIACSNALYISRLSSNTSKPTQVPLAVDSVTVPHVDAAAEEAAGTATLAARPFDMHPAVGGAECVAAVAGEATVAASAAADQQQQQQQQQQPLTDQSEEDNSRHDDDSHGGVTRPVSDSEVCHSYEGCGAVLCNL
jgi:hypothetical protein